MTWNYLSLFTTLFYLSLHSNNSLREPLVNRWGKQPASVGSLWETSKREGLPSWLSQQGTCFPLDVQSRAAPPFNGVRCGHCGDWSTNLGSCESALTPHEPVCECTVRAADTKVHWRLLKRHLPLPTMTEEGRKEGAPVHAWKGCGTDNWGLLPQPLPCDK